MKRHETAQGRDGALKRKVAVNVQHIYWHPTSWVLDWPLSAHSRRGGVYCFRFRGEAVPKWKRCVSRWRYYNFVNKMVHCHISIRRSVPISMHCLLNLLYDPQPPLPSSPYLTYLHFSPWGFVVDVAYIPQLPSDLGVSRKASVR
jgi:hypothetical protein